MIRTYSLVIKMIILFSFDFFDKDKNIEITSIEIEDILLKGLNNKKNCYKDCVKKIIMEVDIDNDGNISYKKFKEMMKNLLQ